MQPPADPGPERPAESGTWRSAARRTGRGPVQSAEPPRGEADHAQPARAHACPWRGAPEYSLACGASACSPAGQMVQPCADSAARSWFVQCLHRYSSPSRSARYTARTAGPHLSHVWFICPPLLAGSWPGPGSQVAGSAAAAASWRTQRIRSAAAWGRSPDSWAIRVAQPRVPNRRTARLIAAATLLAAGASDRCSAEANSASHRASSRFSRVLAVLPAVDVLAGEGPARQERGHRGGRSGPAACRRAGPACAWMRWSRCRSWLAGRRAAGECGGGQGGWLGGGFDGQVRQDAVQPAPWARIMPWPSVYPVRVIASGRHGGRADLATPTAAGSAQQ